MTTNQPPNEIIVRLHRAMDAATGLPDDDVENVQLLIEVGESLEAFETLCTQIYEREISLPSEKVRDLEFLGGVLGANRRFTDYLWEDASEA